MPAVSSRVGRARSTPNHDRPLVLGLGGAHGIEVPHLGRYLIVAVVVCGCLMLSAWSRVDYRNNAVALQRAETRYKAALAERERFELERAALRDPARLAAAALQFNLGDDVRIETVLPTSHSDVGSLSLASTASANQ